MTRPLGCLRWHFATGPGKTACGRSSASRQRDVFAESDATTFRALPEAHQCRRCMRALSKPTEAPKRSARPLFTVEGMNRNGAAMSIPDCSAADVRFWRQSSNFTVTAVVPQGAA